MGIFVLLSSLLFLLVFIARPDYAVMWSFVLLIPFLLFTKRKAMLFNVLLAAIVGFSWMLVGGSQYGYNQHMLVLLGFNSFPLFAWPLGLFAVHLIVSRFTSGPGWKRIMVYCLIFWILLISAETIAYHWLNIRNSATSAYAGLPFCDCMHAPRWMQAAYLLLGPIYILLAELFRPVLKRLR
jgi:hypothetical protein